MRLAGVPAREAVVADVLKARDAAMTRRNGPARVKGASNRLLHTVRGTTELPNLLKQSRRVRPARVMLGTPNALVRPAAPLLAMIVLLSSGLSFAQEDAATRSLRATTLSGVDVTVPDPAKAAVLVVGFGRAAGRQVRLWRLRIDEMESGQSVASVLVVDKTPRLVRGTMIRMMRGQVEEGRQNTIYLVTEDGEAWRELAQFDETAGSEDAYVLRFDGNGQVCFRHAGPVTDAAATGLLAANCGSGPPGEAPKS